MILITGATGKLGQSVIEHLLTKTKASEIIAFVRDQNKIRDLIDRGIGYRIGNYDDTKSIADAMIGIDKVVLISGLDENRFQQHKNIIDAAKLNGVTQIVYTSLAIKDINQSEIKSFMMSHFQTEDYIKDSGLNFTIMRNTLYTDGIQMFAGDKVFETGIFLPAGYGKVPYALRNEMGEAIANVVLQDGHLNKTYMITGNSMYSYDDVAKQLTKLSGNEVNYTNAEEQTFLDAIAHAGLPDFIVSLIVGFSKDIKNSLYEIESDDLKLLLNRQPAALDVALKEIYQL